MKSLLIIAFASALLCVLQSYPVEVDLTLKFDPENKTELTADSMDISTLLEKANANLDKIPDGTVIRFGDIAVDPLGSTNADPCTARSCKWPTSSDGNVYIPVKVSSDFCEGIFDLYQQYAFSSNGKPTIVPKPDPNVSIGRATQFSQTDIERINRLYNCSMCCPLNEPFFRFPWFSVSGFLKLNRALKQSVTFDLALCNTLPQVE
ncbi:UNVERIFIED_CONTAM: hypothetical protein FKN15_006199 [Acipenser sinensis]